MIDTAALFARGTVRRWRTTRPVPWDVGRKASGHRVTIPAGTEFESSVPRLLRWWMRPDDPRYLLAALVHDYLLEAGIYGRLQAAADWDDAARAAGAPAAKTNLALMGIMAKALWLNARDRRLTQNQPGAA